MQVPLLDVCTQNHALKDELFAAFERVFESGRFILGSEVELFERQIAEEVDVKHAVGVSSGTDAILLALMVLGIGPGDEVLCPTFTFFATAGCIARVGATPVFVDACPQCCNIDVTHASSLVTPRTKAIIPVHLFGQSADMNGVMALADRHQLAVIEDAAQSLGAAHHNRKVGGIGTMGTFSFFPSKNLGGLGDGGMLVTNDDTLADRARVLRAHGGRPKYFHSYVGGNFRLDALQAAFLSVKLTHYSDYTGARCENANRYTRALSGLRGIELPTTHSYATPIWNQYTLRVTGNGQRDELRTWLKKRGIGSEIYYPVPMHKQECFASVVQEGSTLPKAERLSEQCLSIPIYPEMTEAQQEYVVAEIKEFTKR